jgi:hypothetical protein
MNRAIARLCDHDAVAWCRVGNMETGMKRLLWGLFCLLCSGAVLADSWSDAMRKQVRASMLVTGTIVVTQDGSVNSYTLDQQNKLPPTVVNAIAQSLSHWKFALDVSDFQEYMRLSQAKLLKAKMNLRLLAVPIDDKNYAVSIADASFGDDTPGEYVSVKKQVRPDYPAKSLRDRVSGKVYVQVRIDRSGHVADLVAYQVDLRNIAPEHDMAIWRRDLANAAVKAIRQWTFNAPTVGGKVDAEYWYANVPVDFQVCELGSRCKDEYGKWLGYLPGQKLPIPWMDSSKAAPGNTDAIPSDVAFQPDQRLKLVTSLDKS